MSQKTFASNFELQTSNCLTACVPIARNKICCAGEMNLKLPTFFPTFFRALDFFGKFLGLVAGRKISAGQRFGH